MSFSPLWFSREQASSCLHIYYLANKLFVVPFLCFQLIFPSDHPKSALPVHTLNDISVLQDSEQAEGQGTIKGRDQVFLNYIVFLAFLGTADIAPRVLQTK